MSFIKVLLVLSIVAHVGLAEEISAQGLRECTRSGYYYRSNLLRSCYRMVTTPHDWFQAKKYCRISGGHLVAIETLEEHAFLEHLVRASSSMNGCIWTSGNEITTKHKWEWQGWNTRFGFTLWARGEPNDNGGKQERCMCLYDKLDYRWNDNTCTWKAKFICERKM